MKKNSRKGIMILLVCMLMLFACTVTTSAATVQKQTTANLNLRSKSGTTGTIIATIPKGTVVTLLGKSAVNENWYYVTYESGSTTKKGWVSGKYLGPVSGSGSSSSTTQKIGIKLYLRSSAKVGNNRIKRLAKNATVTILKKVSSRWYYVKTSDGKKGYIPTGFFVSDRVSGKIYKTTASALNYRKTRKVISSNRIGVIPKGKKVQVLKEYGNWFKIYYGGRKGWVKAGYFLGISESADDDDDDDDDDDSSSSVSGTTTANVRLRSSRSTSSDSNILDVIPKGSKVTLLVNYGNWYKVTYSGQTGYVYASYINE